MTRALIADDEPPLARYCADVLAHVWPELTVAAVVHDGLAAARRIDELQPDIAFLDIQMPGLTGLEVAQGIEGTTQVVFVTAYDAYAVQAFDAEAVDYLLKPITEERVRRCIERVQRALQPASREGPALDLALRRLLGGAALAAPPLKYIRASAGDTTHQIDVDDVLVFQAGDKYTGVRTVDGVEHLIRTPIQDLARQLDPQRFRQVHRATIVNLRFVAGTRRDETSRLWLRVKGHTAELAVSRAYVHLFKAM